MGCHCLVHTVWLTLQQGLHLVFFGQTTIAL